MLVISVGSIYIVEKFMTQINRKFASLIETWIFRMGGRHTECKKI